MGVGNPPGLGLPTCQDPPGLPQPVTAAVWALWCSTQNGLWREARAQLSQELPGSSLSAQVAAGRTPPTGVSH